MGSHSLLSGFGILSHIAYFRVLYCRNPGGSFTFSMELKQLLRYAGCCFIFLQEMQYKTPHP